MRLTSFDENPLLNWSQPEFSLTAIALNMNMGWLIAIARITEEAVGANAK
ncbi:MAG: hypothetical protein WBG32_20380 [Nodosilinea sp.]